MALTESLNTNNSEGTLSNSNSFNPSDTKGFGTTSDTRGGGGGGGGVG